MQSQSRFFDDLARIAAGAVGTLSEVKNEVEARLRDQLEKLVSGLDLVDREEFEAVKAMAAKARAEQEDLAARFAALEARFAALAGSEPAVSQTPGPAGSDPRPE